MKLEDLREGDTVDRGKNTSPLLYERRVSTIVSIRHDLFLRYEYTYVFRDLETWEEVLIHSTFSDDVLQAKKWVILERSLPVGHSGSVESDGGLRPSTKRKQGIIMAQQNLTSDNATNAKSDEPKAKKTRTVDYTRTDKRPHSFRYKRHSTFVARSGAVSLSKEADGAFVIGPAPEGSTAEAGKLEAGQLELVSVKKRPNGKTAIAFSHPELGVVVAYDARAARAALRAG